MKKPVLLLMFFLSLGILANAQSELVVKNNEKGLHLEHKVAAKEGLYSIGRLYNVNPKHIAAYNKIDLNSGLAIDQVIQIPLTDTNFTQRSNKGVPVYYTVGANEGLAKVSSANRKVAVQNLRTWNNLSGDNITEGKKLIVGYLISKEMTAVAAKNPVKQVAEEKAIAKEMPAEEKPLAKTEAPKTEAPKVEPIVKESRPVVTEEAKKTEAVFAKENNAVSTEGQGYFKTYFDQQVRSTPATKNSTVTSGIFKTNSGWQDGKYYLLVDAVPTGSIVKLINPDNNKVIYAKVLGQMNGIRQNEGLGIRISNAAAAALSVAEGEKFILKMNY